jgi:hypothetical protein
MTVQLYDKNLMVIHQPPMASEPPSVHCGHSMEESMGFHIFTLSEDSCLRLLVKNLGMDTPESVLWEELESLKYCDRGVTQLQSERRDQDPGKNNPPTPISLFTCRECLRCPKCDYSPISAACECWWSRTWPKMPIVMQELLAL